MKLVEIVVGPGPLAGEAFQPFALGPAACRTSPNRPRGWPDRPVRAQAARARLVLQPEVCPSENGGWPANEPAVECCCEQDFAVGHNREGHEPTKCPKCYGQDPRPRPLRCWPGDRCQPGGGRTTRPQEAGRGAGGDKADHRAATEWCNKVGRGRGRNDAERDHPSRRDDKATYSHRWAVTPVSACQPRKRAGTPIASADTRSQDVCCGVALTGQQRSGWKGPRRPRPR